MKKLLLTLTLAFSLAATAKADSYQITRTECGYMVWGYTSSPSVIIVPVPISQMPFPVTGSPDPVPVPMPWDRYLAKH